MKKIESIVYEEQYIDLCNPSEVKTVDTFLIKSTGEIFRKLNGKTSVYDKATKEDFVDLEKELIKFIDEADHTVYFFDNMKVSIIISYCNGSKQIVERGLVCNDEYLDSIIEAYIDEFVEC